MIDGLVFGCRLLIPSCWLLKETASIEIRIRCIKGAAGVTGLESFRHAAAPTRRGWVGLSFLLPPAPTAKVANHFWLARQHTSTGGLFN
jgi:hypothetical protein